MVMRIGGLASGMEIDDIVAKMMLSYKAPVNRMSQKKQVMEWQRDDYRALNSQMLDFRNNKLQPMIFSSTYNAKTAEVSGNTSVVTAQANSASTNGSLNVTVQVLATAATNVSVGDIRTTPDNPDDGPFNANDTLANQIDLGLISDFSQSAFSINGKEITIDKELHSLNDVIRMINSETNVSAYFDENSGRIAFASKQTGHSNGANNNESKITFSGDFLTGTLRVDEASGVAAENALATVNGLQIERESNTFSINGVELTLTGVSEVAATVEVKTDTDAIINTIKTFINDYNDLLSSLQDKLSEPRHRDFLPLSNEQRKEMRDNGDDIEAWEEKAMSGLLRSDPLLTRAVADMRNIMTSVVDTGSDINSLASLGIGGMHYSEQGKLHILDEDKLRNAIENDPDAVIKLFNHREDSNPVGIAERLYSGLKVTMDEVTKKAGNTGNVANTDLIGLQIDRLNKQIEDRNQYLIKIENGLYRKFTAMETAIARYSSQSAYLMNAFGGGQQ